MLFNSIDFIFFLPTVFILYWFFTNWNLKVQNLLIVCSSYIFYGWWDWRFLSLIIFSTVVDFIVGINLSKNSSDSRRKFLLYVSIFVNIGFLGFFKYFNFFVDSFYDAFMFLGVPFSDYSLKIILPVGISFYTFQTLSYTLDVYKGKLKATDDFISFSAFVSFFPQLVAGPIERATNLLPQFQRKRHFDYSKAVDGMRQILWGFFKKIVIADNCAIVVNYTFENYHILNGSTLGLGAVFFAFQIYCDFSGYSDIAIGTSRLFGFDLMKNFAFPYFSRDIAEFWRRWHISLSYWFRDYLYIPLGGSRSGNKILNIFVIFVVSGFWHGANWTFIAWGAINALYFLPLLLTNNNRTNLDIVAQNKYFPSIYEFFQMLSTFLLTIIAWVFFRSNSLNDAFGYLSRIFSNSIFDVPNFENLFLVKTTTFLILIFIIIEWIGRENEFAISKVGLKWNILLRYSFYYVLIISMFYFGKSEQQFIYFQF